MDPTLNPTQTSEEISSTNGPEGSQVVKTRRSQGATQVAQEVHTQTSTPTGTSMRTEQMIAPAPAAARVYSRQKELFRTYQVLWYILGLFEIFLAFRFFLKLAGANPNSGFVSFIYGATQPMVGPFLDAFHATPSRGAETTSYFEWSTLLAGFVFALVVWGIIRLLQFGKPTNPEEVDRVVSET